MGVKNPVIYTAKQLKGDISINFFEDYVILSMASQGTNKILNDPQKEHFLHRYFK